jgi:DNA-binding CsgD family transcriptional regulator
VRGREQEWSAVSGLLQHTRTGGSGTLLVEGEPGIGKSLLLTEAANAAARTGFVVAAAAADELSRFTPAGPLLAALGESPSALASGESRPSPADQPMWLIEALRERLERRARAGPVLVVMDDLQWADPLTLASLRLLPMQLASYPLAWILARSGFRQGDAGVLFTLLANEGAQRLVLPPLADEVVAQVIADALGAAPDRLLLGLAAGAAGNPSLIADLLAGLLDEHGITIDGGQAILDTTRMPLRTQAGVLGRFGGLGSRTRQLVETAAILGRSFRLEDAAAMLGTSAAQLLPIIDEALAADIIVATPEALSFRHQLVWQAITDGLAPPVRQALHRQFGEILLARGSALQAAPHLIAAARSDDPMTLARLDQAVPGVLPVSPVTAAGLAVRALELTGPDAPERLARSVSAAETLTTASRLDEADQVICEVLGQPMPGRQAARLHSTLSRVLHLRGCNAEAVAAAEQALAEPGLPRRVRDEATIALLQALTGSRDSHRGAEIAADIRDRPAGHTREVRVAALIVLALIRWDEARISEALDLCREAVLLADGRPPDLRLAQTRLTLAARLMDIRQLTEAARLIHLARATADPLTDLEPAADPALLCARMYLAEGKLDDAVAEAETARQIASALGAHARLQHAHATLARIALRRGDLRTARRLQASPGQAEQPEDPGLELRNELVWAGVAEASGGPKAAMIRLSGTYQALPEHRWTLIAEPAAASWLVRLALATGQLELAERTASVAADIAAANQGFPTVLAAAEHAQGLLAGDPVRLKQACQLHGDPWARASAAEDRGAVLIRDGDDRGDAVGCLDVALDGYQQVGAVRDMARVRWRLRRMGVRRRHWKTHQGPDIGWDSLTDAERSISELVSQGLSNQQVADRKYVSVHTVAFHLRQVFRKLGISSRVELARIAVEHVPRPATES